jgi:hypothetical protein
MAYEVSLCHDEAARFVIARDVEQPDLYEQWKVAEARIAEGSTPHPPWRTPAIMIQTMEWATTKERWERDFYDKDKAGRRRRRFKKPQIEKDWEAWVKKERKAVLEARRATNIHAGDKEAA